jgi:hypothetical protein
LADGSYTYEGESWYDVEMGEITVDPTSITLCEESNQDCTTYPYEFEDNQDQRVKSLHIFGTSSFNAGFSCSSEHTFQDTY